jgi:hypothetical protein
MAGGWDASPGDLSVVRPTELPPINQSADVQVRPYGGVMPTEVWYLLQDPRGPQIIKTARRLDAAGRDRVVIPHSQDIGDGDPLVR